MPSAFIFTFASYGSQSCSPHCRFGTASLHNWVSQNLIINLFIYVYKIHTNTHTSTGPLSLENSNINCIGFNFVEISCLPKNPSSNFLFALSGKIISVSYANLLNKFTVAFRMVPIYTLNKICFG